MYQKGQMSYLSTCFCIQPSAKCQRCLDHVKAISHASSSTQRPGSVRSLSTEAAKEIGTISRRRRSVKRRVQTSVLSSCASSTASTDKYSTRTDARLASVSNPVRWVILLPMG